MSVHLPDDVAARLKNSDELIPTIAQDYKSGEVLMLAYMNAQSLAITIETGRATYWSRSRSELWEKGATSGHTQKVISISLDCDGDALPDTWELSQGLAFDCDANDIPDNCDIASGADDKNANGELDACEFARGDLNLDGVINAADLAVLLAFWGVPNPPVGDLDGDGTVNGADLATLLVNWGT
jgi:phosphoribosyl-AMP cyclohydrolase